MLWPPYDTLQNAAKRTWRRADMVYRGHVENGVVVLDETPRLPKGAEVQVAVLPSSSEVFILGSRLMKFSEKFEGLPTDLARNHDHYLHGTSK